MKKILMVMCLLVLVGCSGSNETQTFLKEHEGHYVYRDTEFEISAQYKGTVLNDRVHELIIYKVTLEGMSMFKGIYYQDLETGSLILYEDDLLAGHPFDIAKVVVSPIRKVSGSDLFVFSDEDYSQGDPHPYGEMDILASFKADKSLDTGRLRNLGGAEINALFKKDETTGSNYANPEAVDAILKTQTIRFSLYDAMDSLEGESLDFYKDLLAPSRFNTFFE